MRAGAPDAAIVRAIRLRTLADAPDAFGTTLAEDEALPDAVWRARVEDPAKAAFLAMAGGAAVGVAFGAPYDSGPGDAGLFGMWVAPDWRRRGVAVDIVDAVVAWARARGSTRLLLDVADGNTAAIRLYESRGFVPTGVTGSLPPPRERILEHQHALDLR